MGFKKKSPVYLKGEAVQSRNHSSVTITFSFIIKLKRLPFGNRLTNFVQIFLLVVIFEALSRAHFHHILWGWVNKGVQLSMEWPMEKTSKNRLNLMPNSFFYIPRKVKTSKMRLNFAGNNFIFGRINCENAPKTFFINLIRRILLKCIWT